MRRTRWEYGGGDYLHSEFPLSGSHQCTDSGNAQGDIFILNQHRRLYLGTYPCEIAASRKPFKALVRPAKRAKL